MAYQIKVTSGDPTVKRRVHGINGIDRATKPNAAPTSATAIVKSDSGNRQLPMTFDIESAVYLTHGPLESDFNYQIVSGEAEANGTTSASTIPSGWNIGELRSCRPTPAKPATSPLLPTA